MKKLAKGNRLARTLSATGVLVTLWGFVYPRPYTPLIVILAALPWIGLEIVRRSGGLFRVDRNRNDTHPSVAIAFVAPGLVLGFRIGLAFSHRRMSLN
jgi:hypothetical protein